MHSKLHIHEVKINCKITHDLLKILFLGDDHFFLDMSLKSNKINQADKAANCKKQSVLWHSMIKTRPFEMSTIIAF